MARCLMTTAVLLLRAKCVTLIISTPNTPLLIELYKFWPVADEFVGFTIASGASVANAGES